MKRNHSMYELGECLDMKRSAEKIKRMKCFTRRVTTAKRMPAPVEFHWAGKLECAGESIVERYVKDIDERGRVRCKQEEKIVITERSGVRVNGYCTQTRLLTMRVRFEPMYKWFLIMFLSCVEVVEMFPFMRFFA